MSKQRSANGKKGTLKKPRSRLPPKNPGADQVNQLATLYVQGRYRELEVAATRVVGEYPRSGFAWGALGMALQQLGRYEESMAPLQKSVGLFPGDPQALSNLGNTLSYLGRYQEAEQTFRRALAIDKSFAEAHLNLGTTLQELHRYDEAASCCRQAAALKPDFADAHYNLGNALKSLQRCEDAETCYLRALQLKPGWVNALNNLGVVLHQSGRLNEAESILAQAIRTNPKFLEAYSNLGLVLHEMGRLDDACAAYRQALQIKPGFAQVLSNYGMTLHAMGHLFEAEDMYRKALKSESTFYEALSNLGAVLQDMGRLEESASCYRQIIDANFDDVRARSKLLFVRNYMYDYSSQEYIDEARQYGEVATSKVKSAHTYGPIDIQPERLRIGFVSGDLRNHPVGYFLESVLVKLASKSVELFAYPTHHRSDELTSRIKPLFAAWKPIYDKNDSAAAQLIQDDNIHVLIDLSGHTQHNRLPIFSWKPAPIQVSWLGYFATTGVAEIDYLIGDRYVTPASEASHFTEKIWELPENYWCFSEPRYTLKVSPLPAKSIGNITFGSFNNLTKMNDAVVTVWSEILAAVPGSRLFLKYSQLDDPKMRELTMKRYAEHGIGSERLILEGSTSRKEYLASYNHVDIALDPFPYPGGTTSIEGLWMGVPFVTKAGDRFLSHAGETIAHSSGLSDWVAVDEEDYVFKTVSRASDLTGLAKLRAILRDQVLASPLFDASGFAGQFETAMWAMWNRWREQILNCKAAR
jgi:predicted O-linked N-acetylglucosamine transferase (SPINDLY family)